MSVNLPVGQSRSLVQDVPGIIATVEAWQATLEERTGVQIELLRPRAEELITGFVGDGTAHLAGAFGLLKVLAITTLVLVGAFFIVAKPNKQPLDPLLRAVPRSGEAPSGGWRTGSASGSPLG